MGLVGYVVVY